MVTLMSNKVYLDLKSKNGTRQVEGSQDKGMAGPGSEQPDHGLGREAVPASG